MPINQTYKNTKNRCMLLAGVMISALAVQSCSSPEVPVHYYSLNTIQQTEGMMSENQQNTSVESNTTLSIQNIDMADFLKTGSLVMQVDSHQIQLSDQHRWADKLPRAIKVNLTKNLSKNKKNIQVVNKAQRTNKGLHYSVTVFFEQFTISEQQETVVSGSYSIHSINNENTIFFDIRQPLKNDGYNSAIQQYQQSLNELSSKIINDIAL